MKHEKWECEYEEKIDAWIITVEGDNIILSYHCSEATAQAIVHDHNTRPALIEALEDPFSYQYKKGSFSNALLYLGDRLGKLDETEIAVWKIWLSYKSEQIEQALEQVKEKP